MEVQLREEYQKIYGLDAIQTEELSYRTIDNAVKFVNNLDDDYAYEFFNILCDASLSASYYAMEFLCEKQDRVVQKLRLLYPFVFFNLVRKLSYGAHGKDVIDKLCIKYKSQMGSQVRLPLKFLSNSFKEYIFSGALLEDIEQKRYLGDAIDAPSISEITNNKNLQQLHTIINNFSRYYIPYDFIAAVIAVLKSQIKQRINV